MGRAKRWFRSLFGTRKSQDTKQNYSSPPSGYSGIGLCNNPATVPPNITPVEAAWLRSFQSKSQSEQDKHTMAVAAATAAAADAPMAAAQAAATVVRLAASQGQRNQFGGSREIWASIKIQTVFRGHLARKALRALRGVVRLQALVRGYLVRKQGAATLRCMQALARAQARVLAGKIRPLNNNNNNNKSQNRLSQFNSMDRVVNTRNEHKMSIHNRRLSASFESPKIMEVNMDKPRSRSRRTNTWMPNPGEELFDQSITSPLPAHRFPAHISIPNSRNFRGRAPIECQGFFRAEVGSPRSAGSCGCDVPITPARSFCVESYFKNTANYQNYMANTHSFEAKLRSQSAPRQRPNPSLRRRPSCPEIKEPRNSLDSVRMQRSKEEPKGHEFQE